MDLSLILSIVEIVLAVFVVTAILLQQRGTGMGGAFGGGGGDTGNIFATRRGAERILFLSTIVASILFFSIALAQNLI